MEHDAELTSRRVLERKVLRRFQCRPGKELPLQGIEFRVLGFNSASVSPFLSLHHFIAMAANILALFHRPINSRPGEEGVGLVSISIRLHNSLLV